jgi:aspartyl-tRNA(Asn)/glutamyl-tRNA(Gln) amidotransferase subunit A
MSLIRSTAAEMAKALAAGSTTSVELTEAHYLQIERVDPAVHAFLYLDKEGALAQASAVDAKRQNGETLPTLAGVPLALKDGMVQKGIPTRCWKVGARPMTLRLYPS